MYPEDPEMEDILVVTDVSSTALILRISRENVNWNEPLLDL
jgi:hypothetical protein